MTHDKDVVRALLPPAQVFSYFEIEFSEIGETELCTRRCPRCGERTRASVHVNATSGTWNCKAHGCRGDLYALIAGYAGLDVRRGFPAVVALAARIAGVDGDLTLAERERLVADRRRRDAERAERDRAREATARAQMAGAWAALDCQNVRGETYLRDTRALPPAPLRERDVVRFTRASEPAVPLRDLVTGVIVGIQYRRLVVAGDERRHLVLTGSQVSGAALIGRASDLSAEGIAVIAEGLIDTLTAHLIWPYAAIYGAPGADQLGAVSAALAPRIAQLRGVLLVIGDDDRAGREGAARALAAAEQAGLARVASDAPREPGTVRSVDLGSGLDDRRHHDLNDAWRRSAWRWRWPVEVQREP